MRYQTVIWDWNGTLLHDAGLCRRMMNFLLESRNMPILSKLRYEELFDFPASAYYRRIGFDFERESFEQLNGEFMASYEKRRHTCRLQKGARHNLQALHARGIRQAMLSAYPHVNLQSILAGKKLLSYFDIIVGADDVHAHGKIEQGRRLKGQLSGTGPILMIGDTLHDAEVAAAMQVDFVLVYSGHQSRRRIATAGARMFDTHAELLRWLAGGD